ncbi:uncharacterized protein LOC131598077 [Vicia villosa]|uniref:uncharacterized protein LOC131598077 n=1 Tax=Vicia villosa TaxID=3911 RepID=UPI00273B5182|nr:uncharacterized protein LOC131598077 [Vicia villosa]
MGFQQFISETNIGYVGGISVACKEEELEISIGIKDEQYVHVQVKSKQGHEWLFTAVYASPNEQKRRGLWEKLKIIAGTINISWLVAGDFNDIAFAKEKKGGSIVSVRKCKIFRDNMEECNLTNMQTKGPYYTWRGPIYHGGQRIYERLDRAISNEAWRLMFTEAHVKVLTRVDFSDHHPIMIMLHYSKYETYNKPFRFEKCMDGGT